MSTVLQTEPDNLATIRLGSKPVPGLPVSTRHPYYKYTWRATFEFENATGGSDQQPGLDARGRQNAAADPRVLTKGSEGETATSVEDITLKTFELPRWTTETQVVNQYNHKTIVQTKLNYEPITISFYDQQNDAVDKLIWDFVKGQFDPNDASKKAGIRPLKVTVSMDKQSAGGDPSQAKTYTLGSAYIVDAQHDTLDYSTSDVVLWTITLRYETLDTKDFEGAPPKQAVGIAASQPATPPAAAETTSPTPPAPPATPAVEPIPDASPSLLDLELGQTGPINYNPTGLPQVLDQQRSRARPTSQTTPPGPASGDSHGYTGYESAFIPTVPGLGGSSVGSPSTGTNGAGANANNNRVDRSTAAANRDVRNSREGNTRRITETRELTGEEARQARNEIDRRMADSRARRLGYANDAAYQRAQEQRMRGVPVTGGSSVRISRDDL